MPAGTDDLPADVYGVSSGGDAVCYGHYGMSTGDDGVFGAGPSFCREALSDREGDLPPDGRLSCGMRTMCV